jgi:hypothetical protein
MREWLKESRGSRSQAALVSFLQSYAVFSAVYIKILSSNIKITTKLTNLKTISAHAESTDLIPYRS